MSIFVLLQFEAQPAHTKVQELKYNQQPKKGEGKEERKQNTEEAKKDTAVKSVPLERNSLKRPIQPSSAPDHPGIWHYIIVVLYTEYCICT